MGTQPDDRGLPAWNVKGACALHLPLQWKLQKPACATQGAPQTLLFAATEHRPWLLGRLTQQMVRQPPMGYALLTNTEPRSSANISTRALVAPRRTTPQLG